MAAMTEPSTAFCSAAFDSGNASFALGLPSSKNSSSADLAPLMDGLAKYASLSLSSSYTNFENRVWEVQEATSHLQAG
jgi:hypothetical protein